LPSPNLVRSLLLAFFSIAASFSQAQEPAPATEPSPAAEQRAKAHFQFKTVTQAALAVEHLWLTADYQFVLNPAYNRDRGPVHVFGIRFQAEI